MDVVVQIPAYQEGRQLARTAEQINAQLTPAHTTVDVEAWVTLSPPDRSLCDTWQAAMDARGVDTFEAPRGKLTARNAAHDEAVTRGYDVIVQWDADAPPLQDDTLTRLLEPFHASTRTVATNSRPVAATEPSVVDRVVDVAGRLEDAVNPHLHGQCSAFLADVWAQEPGFGDSIDQSDIDAVRREEEFDFYDRLDEYGAVVGTDALVYNDARRHRCRLPLLGDPDFCSRRAGTTTFRPRNR